MSRTPARLGKLILRFSNRLCKRLGRKIAACHDLFQVEPRIMRNSMPSYPANTHILLLQCDTPKLYPDYVLRCTTLQVSLRGFGDCRLWSFIFLCLGRVWGVFHTLNPKRPKTKTLNRQPSFLSAQTFEA